MLEIGNRGKEVGINLSWVKKKSKFNKTGAVIIEDPRVIRF